MGGAVAAPDGDGDEPGAPTLVVLATCVGGGAAAVAGIFDASIAVPLLRGEESADALRASPSNPLCGDAIELAAAAAAAAEEAARRDGVPVRRLFRAADRARALAAADAASGDAVADAEACAAAGLSIEAALQLAAFEEEWAALL